jgi:hypothetical protein
MTSASAKNRNKSQLKGSAVAALFQGFNSVSRAGLSIGIEKIASVKTNAVSHATCTVCMSSSEVAKAMNIEQSASVGIPLFSVEEKVTFANSLKITKNSVSVVVYAFHSSGDETATEYKVDTKKLELAKGDMRTFFLSYGDSFVSSIRNGGEYYATYTFLSETQEEKESIVTGLKASGIVNSVSASAEVQTGFDNFLKTCKVQYSVKQHCTGIANPVLAAKDDIISFGEKFTSKTLDSPVIISFETTGYENVAGLGPIFSGITERRTYFTGNSESPGMNGRYDEICRHIDQMGAIAKVHKFYGNYTDPNLAKVQAQAKADRATLGAQRDAYNDNPIQIFVAPDLPSLSYGTPSLQYDVNLSDARGGEGGKPFDDVEDVETYLMSTTQITGIQLRGKTYVNRLTTTYTDRYGDFICRRGHSEVGSDSDLIKVDQTKRVDILNCYVGKNSNQVDKLKITLTNKKSIVTGNADNTEQYDLQTPSGYFTLGFCGRCGADLDQIQVYSAKLKPTTWSKD